MIVWLAVVMLSLPRTQGSHGLVAECRTSFYVTFTCSDYLDITAAPAVEFSALRYADNYVKVKSYVSWHIVPFSPLKIRHSVTSQMTELFVTSTVRTAHPV
jgi:hypothetical protein